MFKERGNWRPAICYFNGSGSELIISKYSAYKKWDSRCLLCALLPLKVVFPDGYDQRDPTTLQPIHNCWFCNLNTVKESPYMLIELCKYVDPVILKSIIDDYCKNLNETRRGICCYV